MEKVAGSLRKSQRTGPDFKGMPIAIYAVAHIWIEVRVMVQRRDDIDDEYKRA